MESWAVFYLAGVMFGIGCVREPSNGSSLGLFILSMTQFAVAGGLKFL